MDSKDSLQPALSWAIVQFLLFWAKWPDVSFTQDEVQFALAGVTNERTKFYHIINQMDTITSPSVKVPYIALRAELVCRLSPLREQSTRQLLTLELGKNVIPVPAAPQKSHPRWAGRLPAKHLGQPAIPKHTANSCQPAWEWIECWPTHRHQQSSAAYRGDFAAGRCTWCYAYPSSLQLKEHRPDSRSPSWDKAATSPCLCNHDFRAQAQNYTQPCAYR